MSAVIYPAKSVRKGQRTKSPQYADRNLGLVWGKIRDAGIYAAPLEHQLDYGVYSLAHYVRMADTDSMTALNAEIDSMIVPLVP